MPEQVKTSSSDFTWEQKETIREIIREEIQNYLKYHKMDIIEK